MSDEDLNDAIVPGSVTFEIGHDVLQYEDVTSAEIEARLAAFMATEGVTVVDGVVSWVYRSPECTCRRSRPGEQHEIGCAYRGPDFTMERLPE